MREHNDDRGERVGERSLSNLIGGYFSGDLASGLNGNQRGARAWYEVCGTRERNHTCGIFLKEEEDKNPLLVVYLDTNVIMQDFATNKEIYLLRLDSIGFPVSDIQFRLSKFKKAREREVREQESDKRIPTRNLTEEELETIDTLSGEITSPTLRSIVREAMISNKKWEIAESTQEHSKNR